MLLGRKASKQPTNKQTLTNEANIPEGLAVQAYRLECERHGLLSLGDTSVI